MRTDALRNFDCICLSDFLFAHIVTPSPPLPLLQKLRVAVKPRGRGLGRIRQLTSQETEPPAQNAKKLGKQTEPSPKISAVVMAETHLYLQIYAERW